MYKKNSSYRKQQRQATGNTVELITIRNKLVFFNKTHSQWAGANTS